MSGSQMMTASTMFSTKDWLTHNNIGDFNMIDADTGLIIERDDEVYLVRLRTGQAPAVRKQVVRGTLEQL